MEKDIVSLKVALAARKAEIGYVSEYYYTKKGELIWDDSSRRPNGNRDYRDYQCDGYLRSWLQRIVREDFSIITEGRYEKKQERYTPYLYSITDEEKELFKKSETYSTPEEAIDRALEVALEKIFIWYIKTL